MIESNKFHLACLNSICEGKPRYKPHQEMSTSHFALNNTKKKKKEQMFSGILHPQILCGSYGNSLVFFSDSFSLANGCVGTDQKSYTLNTRWSREFQSYS